MKPHIQKLLDLQLPLPSAISDARANCFNAVELFWEDESQPKFSAPQDFVTYLAKSFLQTSNEVERWPLDVAVVWSRSANVLKFGEIKIESISRRDSGYPFGLVIEHSFVQLDETTVFQKRDPSATGGYELVSLEQALRPYIGAVGFEVTHHRRRKSKL